MKILITADKFRGSLEADQVIAAIGKGIHHVDSSIEIISSTLADGGEGSMKLLSDAFDCVPHTIKVKNAIGKEIESSIGFNKNTSTAVLEMASYVGLAQLSQTDRNPQRTSSFGLGQAINEAVSLGANKIIIGIGGSATNDGGVGMLLALGYTFLDQKDQELQPCGGNLGEIKKILRPTIPLTDVKIIIASDVDNPIVGPKGATMVYAKQKGASNAVIEKLEKQMIHYTDLVQAYSNVDVRNMSGYGAAGGIPLSACTFLNAELISGSQLIFDTLELEQKIKDADFTITGEGKIDHQSIHGKAISPIIEACSRLKKECILVCGLYEKVQDKSISDLQRYELSVIANEQNLDSYKDAEELCYFIGSEIAKSKKTRY